jgi:pimeloyl-ACP methyl ester carboxylesterase
MDIDIDRAFVRISEGLVHLRKVEGTGRPLLMIHLSPSSSQRLEPVMRNLRSVGFAAPLIAPDTLGNGQSCKPAIEEPDINYFAGTLVRLLDAMGIDQVDLFGMHTGARTACEFAHAFPDRTGRVVIDGITEYSPQMRALFKEKYTPKIVPDEFGSQLIWAFNFSRNQHLYYPWFMQDAAHSLNKTMPSPEALQAGVLEILNSYDSYHMAYSAAFQYPSASKVPSLTVPTLLMKPEDGTPAINAAADTYANGRNVLARDVTGGELGFARAIADFITGTDAS